MNYHFPNSYADIDLRIIQKNLEAIKARHPGKKILAVVKCDAYGHGAPQVARHIEEGVDWFGLASVDEGIQLRMAGIKKPILIYEVPTAEKAAAYLTHNLAATVSHRVHFSTLMDGTRYHLNFDTGMNRLGFKPDEAKEVRTLAVANQRLICSGIYSHYATADDPGSDFVTEQQNRFKELTKYFAEVPLQHMSNSGAMAHYPDIDHFDMIRTGLALYGYLAGDTQVDWLTSALEWKTDLAQVRPIKKGEGVSYGGTWRAPSDGYLGTVAVGYGDGIPRALSSKLSVTVNGKRYPVAGRITMDYLMIWLGEDKLSPGAEVVLMGREGPDAQEWAKLSGSNAHEILTAIRSSVARNHLK